MNELHTGSDGETFDDQKVEDLAEHDLALLQHLFVDSDDRA